MKWSWSRRPKTSIAVEVENLPDSVTIIPSSEATDPFTYALMKAAEGGVGYIYCDDEGVWRDGDDNPVDQLNEVDGAGQG